MFNNSFKIHQNAGKFYFIQNFYQNCDLCLVSFLQKSQSRWEEETVSSWQQTTALRHWNPSQRAGYKHGQNTKKWLTCFVEAGVSPFLHTRVTHFSSGSQRLGPVSLAEGWQHCGDEETEENWSEVELSARGRLILLRWCLLTVGEPCYRWCTSP